MKLSNKLRMFVGLFAAGTALCTQAASAQSLRDFQHDRVTDTRASAAITIPLGAQRGSAQAKPRFDFTLATQNVGTSHSVTPLRIDPDFERQTLRAAKLSFTLEQNPRLLLNDQRIATFGPRLTADEEEGEDGGGGLGTAGWIVLGVGALAGVGFWFVDSFEDDLEDAFGIDD